ncbi:MAG: DUF1934 domain-containing protein [Lachnospiraceae bacterium]|jgi:uncharacterized beta-barrel protein YwiB (DUF1934 family)|nr:DUF1934 domain-containing protein [Lachnospiraceae bacterium]MBQ5558366.1 DUF1934 domain-containing protein [Lachnospiraceae bacterium]MCR4803186.1 DUF1934 domain-containing protein [Lachnospiraceae bacterium]
MTKEVLVAIKGMQDMHGGDSDSVELVSHGVYSLSDGFHLVEYEEIDEEAQIITNVQIKANEEQVEIIRQGPANVNMVFVEQQKTTSCYKTPYGDLDIGINTNKINIMEAEEKIEMELSYVLDMNGKPVSENAVTIRIEAK